MTHIGVNDWYRSNPYHAVKKGFSLLHAMEVMVREGVHRVAVLDERDQVIGISTQSMIISLVSQNANLLGTVKGNKGLIVSNSSWSMMYCCLYVI
jgi:signal-transduction protein with cAMP-binding, CBS, and nucleotidyltransferase domain